MFCLKYVFEGICISYGKKFTANGQYCLVLRNMDQCFHSGDCGNLFCRSYAERNQFSNGRYISSINLTKLLLIYTMSLNTKAIDGIKPPTTILESEQYLPNLIVYLGQITILFCPCYDASDISINHVPGKTKPSITWNGTGSSTLMWR